MPGKILVVDDDIALAKMVEKLLQAESYIPVVAYTAEDGLRLALSENPDLVVLDVMVPGMGGWELCKRLRVALDVPIIFLTALGHTENVVHGLELGADDYLIKPFQTAEFLARIKAQLRRIHMAHKAAHLLNFGQGALVIDLSSRIVTVNGRIVDLTPREFDLLATLAAYPGKVLTTADLIQRAWGLTDAHAEDSVKPYIHYLRKKIEPDPTNPQWIITARGVGYRFSIE